MPTVYDMETLKATSFFTNCLDELVRSCNTMLMDKSWQQVTKDLMREQDRTSTWMANQIGVTLSAFSRWMCGSNNPRIETIKAIAAVLHVPVSRLIDPDITLPNNAEQQLLDDFATLSPENQQTIITLIKSLKQQ